MEVIARKLMADYYGYIEFKPGQELIINNILKAKDCLAVLPTGGGKSLCYQLPALTMPGLTVIISPLIALMKDQVDALYELGAPATFINSSLGAAEVRKRLHNALQGHYKMLYIAPERLQSAQLNDVWQDMPISLVAIDEAHCVSQWGHDFRPSYLNIASWIDSLPKRPILAAFTATATPRVREDIINSLGLHQAVITVNSFDRPNLFFSVIRGTDRLNYIFQYINKNPDDSGIIYAATRKEVDSIYEELNKKGFSVGRYHAGMSDQERSFNQEAFIYDRIQVMVATNAFGLGIDKSNVRYVIHHNMPRHLEAYYQEAGRAGRDGEKSDCIMFYQPADIQIQKFLIEQGNISEELKRAEYDNLRTMIDYCHTTQCLRNFILGYFGEDINSNACDNCSNCGDVEETDITIDAQKIFSCILRMQQLSGSTMVANVLKGSRNKKVLEFKFDKLSTYGIMKDLSVKQIVDLINILTAEDYLISSGDQFPIIKLSNKAMPVLRSQERLIVRFPIIPTSTLTESPLFNDLRKLRQQIAAAQKVAPYMIFSDHSLWEMCTHLPQDIAAFLQIDGVGQIKLEKYGSFFLEAIKHYVAQNKVAPENMPAKISNPSKNGQKLAKSADLTLSVSTEKEQRIPSHLITWQEYRNGKQIETIAAERNLSLLTIENHLLQAAQDGKPVNWEPYLSITEMQQILEVAKTVGADKLRPIKEALPDTITYFQIKIALAQGKD